MPQLDFATFPSQVFWLLVTFTCLYYIVTRHILPQVSSVLENRQEKISSDIERAQSLRNEAEVVKQDYMASLNKARQQANKYLKETSERMESMREERTRELEDKLARQLSEAQAKLAERRAEAEEKMKLVTVELVQDVVGELTDMKPAANDIRKTVDKLAG
jgi:F-type H+-transporting ATPase subunit b